MTPLDAQQQLLAALQHPRCYPHPADALQLIESHISWVILAGPFAYKIKKALNLGFLDYSTLELRRRYCEEELRLNRRTTSGLYLEVVAITGSIEHPQLNGKGPIIEWAVKMERFPQQQLASQLLERGLLTEPLLEQLADSIARFHCLALPAPAGSSFGSSEAVYQPILENFRQLREHLGESTPETLLQPLERWNEENRAALTPLLEQRKQAGFIRECHGDLHLNNIVLLNGEPAPFDGIEFNDNLRYVDVISDIAFLLMDIEHRRQGALAWLLLDRYLQQSGDYAGLALLRFYQVYRAMVRAKVAAIRSVQELAGGEAQQSARQEASDYLQLAFSYIAPQRPQLLITHGFSGSGKSSVARALLMAWGAIRLRSDVERKRLFTSDAGNANHSPPNQGIYTAAASQRTYARLADLSGELLDHGFNVIVDATFLRRSDRQHFIAMAKRHGVAWHLLDIRASVETLRERITARHAAQHDPSEADLAILDYQREHHDPLGNGELLNTLHLDTDSAWSVTTLLARIQQQGY